MTAEAHLLRAYELARSHNPRPNPRVGAVVVDIAGNIIGEGTHQKAGGAHAEVNALEGVESSGATMFVSLEPCSHHGRTPPCVDRIIEGKLGRVVVGALDPDTRVSGSGIERLRSAGIEVEVVDDPGAVEVDPGYFHHRTTGRPLVTYKYAMTADGSIAASDGTSQWITGNEAREDVHRLRASSDVVVVGAGTLATDDPRLDVRLPSYGGPQPQPVIVTGTTTPGSDRQLWSREPLVFATRDMQVPAGEVLVVPGDPHPDVESVVSKLGDLGHYNVLLEGGPKLAGAWWEAGCVDRIVAYVGAGLGGGRGMAPLDGGFESMSRITRMRLGGVVRLGDDVRIDYTRV